MTAGTANSTQPGREPLRVPQTCSGPVPPLRRLQAFDGPPDKLKGGERALAAERLRDLADHQSLALNNPCPDDGNQELNPASGTMVSTKRSPLLSPNQ
jgi:hypothetical protein